jgi:uncharacterized BrkB/YihY/UPF0761 family membrane protein
MTIGDIVPAGTLDLLGEEISRIAAKSDGKLTFGFLLGLGIALWSANAGMKAIFDALNIIYDEEEKRGFIWLNVVSLFFTIGAIAGAGLAVALVVVFPLITAVFGLTSLDAPSPPSVSLSPLGSAAALWCPDQAGLTRHNRRNAECGLSKLQSVDQQMRHGGSVPG